MLGVEREPRDRVFHRVFFFVLVDAAVVRRRRNNVDPRIRRKRDAQRLHPTDGGDAPLIRKTDPGTSPRTKPTCWQGLPIRILQANTRVKAGRFSSIVVASAASVARFANTLAFKKNTSGSAFCAPASHGCSSPCQTMHHALCTGPGEARRGGRRGEREVQGGDFAQNPSEIRRHGARAMAGHARGQVCMCACMWVWMWM